MSYDEYDELAEGGMLGALARFLAEDGRRMHQSSRDAYVRDRQFRDRMHDEGMLGLRQLMHILQGGAPSRDPGFVPPARVPGMLEPRGRAQKQPPIIGVRG